jgi:hypothetical protein
MLTLYDNKAELYNPPFIVPTIGVAFRNLQDEMQQNGGDNVLARHAKDYDLIHIGHWEEEKGEIHSHPPKKVCNLAELAVTNGGSQNEPQGGKNKTQE